MANQLLRLARMLLAVSLLTMCACVLLAVQQFEINNLKNKIRQQDTLNQSQVQFDKTVTNKLLK